jgi:hypothetical protein
MQPNQRQMQFFEDDAARHGLPGEIGVRHSGTAIPIPYTGKTGFALDSCAEISLQPQLLWNPWR